MGARGIHQENPFGVETLTLGEVQENPKRMTVTLRGYAGVCERLEGRTFFLSVVGIYEGPANAECPAIAQEYTQKVTLELKSLEAGVYTVRAGSKKECDLYPAVS